MIVFSCGSNWLTPYKNSRAKSVNTKQTKLKCDCYSIRMRGLPRPQCNRSNARLPDTYSFWFSSPVDFSNSSMVANVWNLFRSSCFRSDSKISIFDLISLLALVNIGPINWKNLQKHIEMYEFFSLSVSLILMEFFEAIQIWIHQDVGWIFETSSEVAMNYLDIEAIVSHSIALIYELNKASPKTERK